jgi:hypothetical protein
LGKFNISPEQEEQLKHGDSTTPVPIPGATGQVKRTYHNPVTGQEIRSLDDRREAEYLTSQQHEEDRRSRYNEDVKTAVLAVLDQLGVDLPDKAGVEKVAPAPAPEEVEVREGTQLRLPFDATSETETKHVVSEASSPELHLVGHREEQT